MVGRTPRVSSARSPSRLSARSVRLRHAPLRAHPALAAPHAEWAALIGALLHPVWLVEARGLRIVAANAAAARLLGLSVDEMLGIAAQELAATPEDDIFWREAAAGRTEPIESDTFVRCRAGEAIPVTRRVSRIDAAGSSIYVVALHDRSVQSRAMTHLERLAAELQATLESSADGLLVTDLAGRIRNFNHRFAELWSLPAELLARRDDDAVLDWMRRSVVEPAAYMRRLAVIDEATFFEATDIVTLHSGQVLERITVPQCAQGRPIGRIASFRPLVRTPAFEGPRREPSR